MADQIAQRRPGGRSARIADDVRRAAEELIAERGSDDFTIAELAERSGVHHATIYRRWGSTEAIVLDVAAARLDDESPIPDTGSLRGDLLAYAKGVARSVEGPSGLTFIRAVVNASAVADDAEPDLALFGRGRQLEVMLTRAADRGEPRIHFTDVIDGILAPIYFRRLFGIGGLSEAFLARLVEKTIAMPEPT